MNVHTVWNMNVLGSKEPGQSLSQNGYGPYIDFGYYCIV